MIRIADRLNALTLCVLFTLSRPTFQIECRAEDIFEHANATDNYTISNPFHPPIGPYNTNVSSNWTWQLSTKSPDRSRNGNASILQSLSLAISPPPSPGLFDQESYIGCGLVIHGLWQERIAKNQNDLKGDCTGFISDECRQWMLSEVEFNAKYVHWKAGDRHRDKQKDSSADSVCQKLSVLKFNGTVKHCKDDFAPGIWAEPFLWASSSLKSADCTAETSSFVAHTWGASSYNLTNLRQYNNLTTSISPIITTLRASEKESVAWARAQLMCLRSGKHVKNGSLSPQEVSGSPSSASQLPKAVPHLMDSTFCALAIIIMNFFF